MVVPPLAAVETAVPPLPPEQTAQPTLVVSVVVVVVGLYPQHIAPVSGRAAAALAVIPRETLGWLILVVVVVVVVVATLAALAVPASASWSGTNERNCDYPIRRGG